MGDKVCEKEWKMRLSVRELYCVHQKNKIIYNDQKEGVKENYRLIIKYIVLYNMI